MSNKIIKILFLTIGATGAFFLNYFFIENIIIPDPCRYLSGDAVVVFKLFYDKPTFNGGHPYLSILNLIFTILAGLLIGWTAYKFFLKKHQKTQIQQQNIFF